jgi:hypothetical protein
MSVHEIYEKKISIVHLPNNKRKSDRLRCNVQERPATLGHFNIGELCQILNRVQKDYLGVKHLFTFKHGRYIVRIYDPKITEYPDDPE